MTYPYSALKLAAGLILLETGCKEASPTRRSPPESSAQAKVATVDAAAVALHLHAPSSVKAGETVPLLLIAQNGSRQAVYLGTGDSTTTFDIRVADRSGKLVWRRMHDRESLASLHEHTLAPGEDLRFSDSWDQRSNEGVRMPAGIYHVQGTLDAQGETDLKTAPRRLEIRFSPD